MSSDSRFERGIALRRKVVGGRNASLHCFECGSLSSSFLVTPSTAWSPQ